MIEDKKKNKIIQFNLFAAALNDLKLDKLFYLPSLIGIKRFHWKFFHHS